MKVTDLAVSCGNFRQWRKAVSLLKNIEQRESFYRRRMSDKILPLHEERLEALKLALNVEIGATRPGREIISSLSSRRAVLNHGTGDLLRWAFKGLPEPLRSPRSEFQDLLLGMLEESARTARAASYKFLTGCELAYRCKAGAFVVFNTLTVAPEHYGTVFSKNSKAFKEYIRSIDRRVDNHTYCATVEEGSRTGRLHVHIVHIFDKMRVEFQDPNRGLEIPGNREIAAMKPLWKWGHSCPIAVRTVPTDAWGKLGWQWPVDRRTDKPLKHSSPMQVASYLSKYITKSYISKQRSDYLWRIRKTHRLGLTLLNELMAALETETLFYLAATPTMRGTLNNWRIPPSLQARLAIKHLLLRLRSTRDELSYLETLGRLLPTARSIAQQPLDFDRWISECSSQSIGFIKTVGLHDEATFRRAMADYQLVVQEFDNAYFPRPNVGYGASFTGDSGVNAVR